jgi:uncharacterized membrane protein
MRKVWNTILKGLVTVLPIGLTIYLVYWLAVTLERVFSQLLRAWLPESAYWPGLGILVGLVLLYLVGLAINAYVVSSVLGWFDERIERIPVVRTIYVAIRDFMRMFPTSGQRSDLKRVVLVPFGPGKAIGFVTAESGLGLGVDQDADVVAVYLPMSYMIGGYTVFVPREHLEPTRLSVEAGMRIALMGGVHGSAAGVPPVADAAR